MPAYQGAELGIFAIYPTRKQLPLRVRKLVDFLVTALQNPQWQASEAKPKPGG
jgi:hypothetical protein